MKNETQDPKNDNRLAVLYSFAVVLILVCLGLTFLWKKQAPTISQGASTTDVSDYAYELVANDQYDEAVTYFANQVAAADGDEETQFNLELDYATFFGDTGDFQAGLDVLDEIETMDLPLDARYYLYATYIYLYGLADDTTAVNDYRQRILDEGIEVYLASLDGVEISTDGACVVEVGDDEEDDLEELDEEDEIDDGEEETVEEEEL